MPARGLPTMPSRRRVLEFTRALIEQELVRVREDAIRADGHDPRGQMPKGDGHAGDAERLVLAAIDLAAMHGQVTAELRELER
jgi:hypothetical protein